MSSPRSIRKSLPYTTNPSSDAMFYNFVPSIPSMSSSSHQGRIRSPQVEETDVKSSDFVWEAEYQDKMTVLKNSISQVQSSERRQINFQFIDDMKATFDFKSLHSKKKKPPPKPTPADKPPATRKDRKGAVKLLEAANAANGNTKKRRPRNAFILYRTVLQAKAEFKGKTQTELSRLIAACWQNEPLETRAHFERAAELEKAFGYGATDVFNIKVGPAEKEWDVDVPPDQNTLGTPFPGETDDTAFPQADYAATASYPMYMSPSFSPTFDQPQPDPYQVQANLQMLGQSFTENPVYAGTPCGQINLSPQQAMFPFNNYASNSSADQNAPMSPVDYGRPNANVYAAPMEHSTSTMTAGESFALHTSPPEASSIPADYGAFENFHIEYQNPGQPEVHSVNLDFPGEVANQNHYSQYQPTNNEMYSSRFQPTSHHALEDNSTNHAVFQQYPNTHLNGYIDLNDPMFNDNQDVFQGQYH